MARGLPGCGEACANCFEQMEVGMDGRGNNAASYFFLLEGGGGEVASSHLGQPSSGFPEGERGFTTMLYEFVAKLFRW